MYDDPKNQIDPTINTNDLVPDTPIPLVPPANTPPSDPSATHPETQGEQSISGTTAAPESDDDTLANAQAVGQQMRETEEKPQEVNIARDIDQAEEYKRTH